MSVNQQQATLTSRLAIPGVVKDSCAALFFSICVGVASSSLMAGVVLVVNLQG